MNHWWTRWFVFWCLCQIQWRIQGGGSEGSVPPNQTYGLLNYLFETRTFALTTSLVTIYETCIAFCHLAKFWHIPQSFFGGTLLILRTKQFVLPALNTWLFQLFGPLLSKMSESATGQIHPFLYMLLRCILWTSENCLLWAVYKTELFIDLTFSWCNRTV